MTHPLPAHGTPWPEIERRMREMAEGDVDWRDGKAAVYVFHAGDDVLQVQKEAYALFQSENGLGPMAFPSLARMEREVVDMALSLLRAPEGARGNVTSGGTDSITMALKTCRDHARHTGRVTGAAKIVLPVSAHLAFDKAAHLMDIEVVRTPLRPDYTADPEAIRAAIDERTLMIVGSAPCFPFGLVDPIPELSEVAQEAGVWLHVDACVGGFLAPFARKLGVELPEFDFAAPGVRSISADLHKFGYAAKGASTVLFRSEELWRHMAFDLDRWPGGRMVTPTLAGTRPGGAIAAAWAVMHYLGEEGYLEKQRIVIETRERLEAGLRERGCEILGTPRLALVAWRHPRVPALALWPALRQRGWFSAIVTDPPGIHLMLSPFHAGVIDRYLADLDAVVAELEAGGAGQDAAEEVRYS